MVRRDISDGRKTLYYVGMGMSALGILLFFSTFVSAAANFGNFNNFERRTQSTAMRAVAGMGFMLVGGVLAGIGRKGLSGSGVVLDPQQAREDVEPWSRMTGGVLKDVLDETGITLGDSRAEEPVPPDFAEKLRQLHALRNEGILTEEEYQREKAEVLEQN